MTAAVAGPLIYVLAAALCSVYTIDTVIVAYNYRFFPGQNPPSSKLLFLAEAFKLLLASSFYLLEHRKRSKDYKSLGTDESDDKVPENWWLGLPHHTRQCFAPPTAGRGWLMAVTAWGKGMLVFAVPAVCYFITNK